MNLTQEDIKKYIEFNDMDLSLSSFVLSLNTNRPQTFTTRFGDGRVFTVFIHYNRCLDNWLMDIYLQTTDGRYQPEVMGIELSWGLDLLMPYRYKQLGEFYIYSKNIQEYDAPTYNDLNSNFIYIWRHN